LRVRVIAELVDSASELSSGGPISWTLDSFDITVTSGIHMNDVESNLDLLSGTYFVRLKIDTTGMRLDSLGSYSNYTVASLESDVDGELAKTRRLTGSVSQGRITAQPNPVPGTTEIRFSVPKTCRVKMTIFDRAGNEVRRLVDGEMMDEGRYAVDLDATGLAPGSYLVEFRYGTRRALQKIVVIH
jgi:hypothetical protein